MVRRWSYINKTSFEFSSNCSFFLLKKRYKLINFKSSVSLKRFNKKYTKFRRKALNRIKHLKNWTIYHNVFKYWSLDYCFFKKICKFQFLTNMFNKNFYFYSFLFNKTNNNALNNWNFTFFNLTFKYTFYTAPSKFLLNRTSLPNNIFCKKLFFLNYKSLASVEETALFNAHAVPFLIKDQAALFLTPLLTNQCELILNKVFSSITLFKIRLIAEYYSNLIKFLFFNVK